MKISRRSALDNTNSNRRAAIPSAPKLNRSWLRSDSDKMNCINARRSSRADGKCAFCSLDSSSRSPISSCSTNPPTTSISNHSIGSNRSWPHIQARSSSSATTALSSITSSTASPLSTTTGSYSSPAITTITCNCATKWKSNSKNKPFNKVKLSPKNKHLSSDSDTKHRRQNKPNRASNNSKKWKPYNSSKIGRKSGSISPIPSDRRKSYSNSGTSRNHTTITSSIKTSISESIAAIKSPSVPQTAQENRRSSKFSPISSHSKANDCSPIASIWHTSHNTKSTPSIFQKLCFKKPVQACRRRST